MITKNHEIPRTLVVVPRKDRFQFKFFLEDSLKCLGIVTWMAYFGSVGSRREKAPGRLPVP